jgi:hypothetical protein
MEQDRRECVHIAIVLRSPLFHAIPFRSSVPIPQSHYTQILELSISSEKRLKAPVVVPVVVTVNHLMHNSVLILRLAGRIVSRS